MEFNEMMLKEEQEIIDEMFKRGELVDVTCKEEIRTKARARNKLLVTAGLGLAGYVIYKTIIKPRFIKKGKTQSEVIVEEEE